MSKQINYKTASISEIAQHFLISSRQVVSFARCYYKDDPTMHEKITDAYKEYVIAKIDRVEHV